MLLGIGYRPIEFDVFGADRSRRGDRLEEIVGILREAWTGEPFDFEGSTITVGPVPRTPGGPTLAVGGSVAASARRAARLGVAFFPGHGDPQLGEIYASECDRLGVTGGWSVTPVGLRTPGCGAAPAGPLPPRLPGAGLLTGFRRRCQSP